MKSLSFVCLLLLSSTLSGQSNPAARRIPPQTSGMSFLPAVSYGAGGYQPESVVIADVNGDGKPDLLLSVGCSDSECASGAVSVLLGRGDGTFQTAVTYASGGYGAFKLAVADVNGDGKPDLVVGNCGPSGGNCSNGTLGVLLGNGDGTFQTALTYYSGGYAAEAVAVADVNGDGKPDLVVTNYCGITCGTAFTTVGVLLGNGDGTFQTAVTYSSGGYNAESVVVADVNGDGKPDLLVTNFCSISDNCDNGDGTVGVLLGNGDGTFQAVVTYDSGGYPAQSVAVADVNGDSKPDLLVANFGSTNGVCQNSGTVGVLLGNGDGTFRTVTTYCSGAPGAASLAIADVNGDGELDIVTVNGCPSEDCSVNVGVLLGKGDGTFQTAETYYSGAQIADSVAVADVNADGRPDIVVANCGGFSGSCTTGTVAVLINTTLTPTTNTLTASENPSNFGQSVTFAVTVTAQQGFYKGTPTGTVNFFDGKTNLGHAALNSSGMAILSISTLTAGTHSITARYNGDAKFFSSTSPVLSQVVQGPSVQLSPKSVNFGNVTIGGLTKQGVLVSIQNIGNTTLTISSIGLTGADSADYFEEGSCSSSIPAGGTCHLTVGFTPITTGTLTAALSITDNAPNSPQTVSLTGVGVQPAVSLSPASLTFPTQTVFTSSKAQTVTLTNTGVGTLSITNIAATGAFTQTNNCGSTVNSGSSCTLNVTFKPTKSGSSTGSLSITDNAPLSPQIVSLNGTGTDIEFTPASFNFGNQPVGTTSLPKKFTLTNKGSVTVSVTKISLTGTDARDFAETNTCSTSIPAGESCSMTVTFTPSTDGKRTADISVTDNGGGSPQTAALSGTGT
jgi:hypothetical protein